MKKNKLLLVILIVSCVFSCGRKAVLVSPNPEKKPNFDNVFAE